MKFLVDEDVAIELTRSLRAHGHEVSLVFEVLGPQTDDTVIWAHAVQTQAMVITCNRQDFLRLAGNKPETGVIILNRRKTRQAECRHVLDLISSAGEQGLKNNINFA